MNEWYQIENEQAIASPAVLVYPERIAENLQRMIALVGDASRLRPHVKTHKLPQIVRMKLAVGINRFKVATIAEAEMTAEAGGQDILLAYQPVGPNISRLIQLINAYPATHFAAIVDDLSIVQSISSAAVVAGVILSLYVDLNVGMNRTGIIPGASAVSLYRSIAASPGLHAAGLHAYDGHLHEPDLEQLRHLAKHAFTPVWEMRKRLCDEGLPVEKVIAAGTPTSKLLATEADIEVGAGTTVLWDAGQPKTSPDLDFLNAAVLLARVISRPLENYLCVDLGHKAVASESPQPRVHFYGLEDAEIVMHSEEHIVLRTLRANDYPIGSVLYGVPHHVCPTIALHQEVHSVRDGRVTESWPVVARNRRIRI